MHMKWQFSFSPIVKMHNGLRNDSRAPKLFSSPIEEIREEKLSLVTHTHKCYARCWLQAYVKSNQFWYSHLQQWQKNSSLSKNEEKKKKLWHKNGNHITQLYFICSLQNCMSASTRIYIYISFFLIQTSMFHFAALCEWHNFA